MRSVKYSNLAEKNHRNPTAFAFTDLGPKLYKQGFNVAPMNITAHGASEYSLKGFLVLSFHGKTVPDLGTM